MDEDGNPVFDEDGTIVMERVSEVVKTATITCTYKVSPSEAAKKKLWNTTMFRKMRTRLRVILPKPTF